MEPSISAARMVRPILVSTTPPQQHRSFSTAEGETYSMDKATYNPPGLLRITSPCTTSLPASEPTRL